MVTRVRIEAEAQSQPGVETALNEAFQLLVGSRYMPTESEFIEEIHETTVDPDTGAIGWKGRRVIRFWASMDEYERAHEPTLGIDVRIDLGDVGANRTMVTDANELAWKIAISALDEAGLTTNGKRLALFDGNQNRIDPEVRVRDVSPPLTLTEAPSSPLPITWSGTTTSATNPYTTFATIPTSSSSTFYTGASAPVFNVGPRLTMVVKGKEVHLWPGTREDTIWQVAVYAARMENEEIDQTWQIRDPEGNVVHPTAKASELTGTRYFVNPPAGTGG